MVSIKDQIYIYPFPVIKDKKYLIHMESKEIAELFTVQVSSGEIDSPDGKIDSLPEIGIHSDGKTKIYKLEDY
jgi:hypothetical protein